MSGKKNLTDIDVAKGLLIICVVVGHIINFDYYITAGIKTIIYSFHMPAFFIISGMLMNAEKIHSQSYYGFIKKRAKRLLIPYIGFELVGGLVQMVLMGTDAVNLIGILYGIVTIHCHVGADWFLPTLFFAGTMFYVSAKNMKIRFHFVVGIVCMVLAFNMSDFNYLIAVLRRIFVAYGYITCGYIGKDFFLTKSKKGMIMSGGVLIIISYFNGVVDLSLRLFHNPVLYCIAGVLGTYMILNIAHYMPVFLKKRLVEIGKESLLIMGTHQHIMLIANCIVGSKYSLQVQAILLVLVSIYETLLIGLKRGKFFNVFMRYQNKTIR